MGQAPTPAFADGLPMPPGDLMVIVGGTNAQQWFSERGRAHAERILALAQAFGLDPEDPLSVLDLGCGCGRIARWLAPQIIATGGRFYGFDINRRLIAWCARNLLGTYVRNRLRSPLPLAPQTVDLAYAYSVLTHLTEPSARVWLAEIARLVRPGGLAILTFHDESYAEAWAPQGARERLAHSDYVVWNDALEGSNYMSTWITRRRFADLAEPDFEILKIVAGTHEPQEQAIAVLRRRS